MGKHFYLHVVQLTVKGCNAAFLVSPCKFLCLSYEVFAITDGISLSCGFPFICVM